MKPKPRKGVNPLTAFYCKRCKEEKHDGANHLPGICDCACIEIGGAK